MKAHQLLPALTLCSHYDIEVSFVDTLHSMGLIHIEIIEEQLYVHEDQIAVLEKCIRLHEELHINIEGIDIVFNLLEKNQALRDELSSVKNRLRLYEPQEVTTISNR